MTVAQLESFVAVAEDGQLTQAARRLHLTAPPLSRRISSLEDELGAPLFVRQARGMVLTDAGESLLPHALGILAALVDAAQSVHAPQETSEVTPGPAAPPGSSTSPPSFPSSRC